jgi:hypothetical protein
MSPVQTNVNLDLSTLAERLSKRFDHEPELRGRIAQALLESTMNNLREIAYRLDPVLWVREVLGVEPAKWQEEFLRATPGRLHSGADRAPVWQDHHRCLGHGTYSFVCARFAQRGRLPCATPERRGRPARPRSRHQGRAESLK